MVIVQIPPKRPLSDGSAMIDRVANYTYRAEYSPEEYEYVGKCLEFPVHSARAPTAHEAIEGIEKIIDEVIADFNECGAALPDPLTDRRYSGTFLVRTSPSLHARSPCASGGGSQRARRDPQPLGGVEARGPQHRAVDRRPVLTPSRRAAVDGPTAAPARSQHPTTTASPRRMACPPTESRWECRRRRAPTVRPRRVDPSR
jgi:predicted HicB family RNase H-like nuclease